MDHIIMDCSVSVTRAFRADGTTYPVYWEVRDSAKGELLMAGVKDGPEATDWCDPNDTSIEYNRQVSMASLRDQGLSNTDAARITWWLVENCLIQA